MPRIEIAGVICLRRPRPAQACRADDDDNDDEDRNSQFQGAMSPWRLILNSGAPIFVGA
jgi:hypothetical protein